MTWDTFTKAIEKSELGSGTQAHILLNLFQRAGDTSRNGVTESSTKSWISGKRKCQVSRYFPDETYVRTQELYHFFRRRPQDKIEKLQQILCKEIDESSPIDCTTKDMIFP